MTTRLDTVALVIASALLSGCAAPPKRPDEPLRWGPAQPAAIRAIGARSVDVDGIVGLSIGIAIDGEIVFAEGFGHADAARTVPATARTIYDVASIGKQFTAAAVLQLAERGAVSLDQRVRTLVPDLPPNFPDATLEHLLRQTSGFLSGDLDESDPPANYAVPRYGLELLSDVELRTGSTPFPEGETWLYSNAGYLALGLVVEAASGQRYDRYVREHVLAPLAPHAMRVCEYAPLPEGSERLHRTADVVARIPYIDLTAYAGQGSICSNVIDLLRWERALQEHRIVSGPSLQAMRSPSTVRGAGDSAQVPYGMAQRIGSLGDGAWPRVGHTGTFDGGSGALYSYPDAGLDIAVLANTRGGNTPHALRIELAIAKLLLGVAPTDPAADRRPITATDRRKIEGRYWAGQSTFTAKIEDDELVVLRDGEEQERLIHTGGLRFRRPDAPDVQEWFLMDGDRAGWWVYSLSGSYVEVLRRQRTGQINRR